MNEPGKAPRKPKDARRARGRCQHSQEVSEDAQRASWDDSELRQIGIMALVRVAKDVSAPAAAQAQAARALLELLGLLGSSRQSSGVSGPGRPMSEMTPEEIEQELQALARNV